ncbi:uncharacterized protein [Diadema setosum]|uniref:uncharacterized protein n=1 Tax=Diadema setosum TaxID=31175 RepID=UPI003B3B7AAF
MVAPGHLSKCIESQSDESDLVGGVSDLMVKLSGNFVAYLGMEPAMFNELLQSYFLADPSVVSPCGLHKSAWAGGAGCWWFVTQDFLKLPISPNSAFEPVTPSRPRCGSTSTPDCVVDYLIDDHTEENDSGFLSCNDGFVKRQIERWEELSRRDLWTDDSRSRENKQVESEGNIPAPIVLPPLFLHGALSLQYLSPLDDKLAILLYAIIQVKADFQMTELRLQHGKWQFDNSKAGRRPPRGRRNPGTARSHEDVSLPRIPENLAENDLKKGVSEQNLSGRLAIKSLTEYRVDLNQGRNVPAAQPQEGIPRENRGGLQSRHGATSPRYHQATSNTQQMMHQRTHGRQVPPDPRDFPQHVPPSWNRPGMGDPQIPHVRVPPHDGHRMVPHHSRPPVTNVTTQMVRTMQPEPQEGQRIGVTHSLLPVSNVRPQMATTMQPEPYVGQRIDVSHSSLPVSNMRPQMIRTMQPEPHEGQRIGVSHSSLPVSNVRPRMVRTMQPNQHEGQRVGVTPPHLPVSYGRSQMASGSQPGPHTVQRFGFNHSNLPTSQVRSQVASNMQPERHEGQRFGLNNSRPAVSHVRPNRGSSMQPESHAGQRIVFDHSGRPVSQVRPDRSSSMQPEPHAGQRIVFDHSDRPLSQVKPNITSSMQAEAQAGQRMVSDHSGRPVSQGRPDRSSNMQPEPHAGQRIVFDHSGRPVSQVRPDRSSSMQPEPQAEQRIVLDHAGRPLSQERPPQATSNLQPGIITAEDWMRLRHSNRDKRLTEPPPTNNAPSWSPPQIPRITISRPQGDMNNQSNDRNRRIHNHGDLLVDSSNRQPSQGNLSTASNVDSATTEMSHMHQNYNISGQDNTQILRDSAYQSPLGAESQPFTRTERGGHEEQFMTEYHEESRISPRLVSNSHANMYSPNLDSVNKVETKLSFRPSGDQQESRSNVSNRSVNDVGPCQQATNEVSSGPMPGSQVFSTDRKDPSEFPGDCIGHQNMSKRFAEGTQCALDESPTSPVSEVQSDASKESYYTSSYDTSRQTGELEWGINDRSEAKTMINVHKAEFSYSEKDMTEGLEKEPRAIMHSSRISESNPQRTYVKECHLPSAESAAKQRNLSAVTESTTIRANKVNIFTTTTAHNSPHKMAAREPVAQSPCDRSEMTAIPESEQIMHATKLNNSDADALQEIIQTLPLQDEVNTENADEGMCLSVQQMDVKGEVNVSDKDEVSISASHDVLRTPVKSTESGGDVNEVHTTNHVPINESEMGNPKNHPDADDLDSTSGAKGAQLPEALLSVDHLSTPATYEENHKDSETDNGVQLRDVNPTSTIESQGSELLNSITAAEPAADLVPHSQHAGDQMASPEIHMQTPCPAYETRSSETVAHNGMAVDHKDAIESSNYAANHETIAEDLLSPVQQRSSESLKGMTSSDPSESGPREKTTISDIKENELKCENAELVIDPILIYADPAQEMFASTTCAETENQAIENGDSVPDNEDHSKTKMDNVGDISEDVRVHPLPEDNSESTEAQLSPVAASLPAPIFQKGTHVSEDLETEEKLNDDPCNDSDEATHDTRLKEFGKVCETQPHSPGLSEQHTEIISVSVNLNSASELQSPCSGGDRMSLSVHSVCEKVDSDEPLSRDDTGLKASSIESKVAKGPSHTKTAEEFSSNGFAQQSEFSPHEEDSADITAVEDMVLLQITEEAITVQKLQNSGPQSTADNNTVLNPETDNIGTDTEKGMKELLASKNNSSDVELIIRELKSVQSHVDPTHRNEKNHEENHTNDADPLAVRISVALCDANPCDARESERLTSEPISSSASKDLRQEVLHLQESPGPRDEMSIDEKGKIRSEDDQRISHCSVTTLAQINLSTEDDIGENSSSERFPSGIQDTFSNERDNRYVVPRHIQSEQREPSATSEESRIDTNLAQSDSNQQSNIPSVLQEVSESVSSSKHATDEPTFLYPSVENNEGVAYVDETVPNVDLVLTETSQEVDPRSEMAFSSDHSLHSPRTPELKSQSLPENHQHQMDSGKGDDSVGSVRTTMPGEETPESSAELEMTRDQITTHQTERSETDVELELFQSSHSIVEEMSVNVTDASHHDNFAKNADSSNSVSSFPENSEKMNGEKTNPSSEQYSRSDLQPNNVIACDGGDAHEKNSHTLSCKDDSKNMKDESKELSGKQHEPVKGTDLTKRYLHALRVDIGKTGRKTLRSFDFKFAQVSKREIKVVEGKDKQLMNSEVQHSNLHPDTEKLLTYRKSDRGSSGDLSNATGDGGKTQSYKVSGANPGNGSCTPLLPTDDENKENVNAADVVSGGNTTKTSESLDLTFGRGSGKEVKILEENDKQQISSEFRHPNLHHDMDKLLKNGDRPSMGDSSNTNGDDMMAHVDKTSSGNTEIVTCTPPFTTDDETYKNATLTDDVSSGNTENIHGNDSSNTNREDDITHSYRVSGGNIDISTGTPAETTDDKSNENISMTGDASKGNTEKTPGRFEAIFERENRSESKVVEGQDKQQMISDFEHPNLHHDMDKKDQNANTERLGDSLNANGPDSDQTCSENAEIVTCAPPLTADDESNKDTNVTGGVSNDGVSIESTESTERDNSNVNRDDDETYSYRISIENTKNESNTPLVTADEETNDRIDVSSKNTEKTDGNDSFKIDEHSDSALSVNASSGDTGKIDSAPLSKADSEIETQRVSDVNPATQPAKVNNDAVLSFRSKANYKSELRKLSREIQAFRSELTEDGFASSNKESFQSPSSDDSEFLALEAMCMDEDSVENRLSLIIDEDIINNLHINEDDVEPTRRGRLYSSESVSSELGVSRQSRIPVPVRKISRSHSCLADIERDDSPYGDHLGSQSRKQRSVARIVPIPRGGTRSMPTTPTLSRRSRSKIPVLSSANPTPRAELKKQSDREKTRSSKTVRPRGSLWSYSSTPDLASDGFDRFNNFRQEKARSPFTPTGTPRYKSLRQKNKQPKPLPPFKPRECAIVPLPEWERLKKVLDSAGAPRASTCPSTPSETCFLSRASSQESWDFPTMSEGYYSPRSPGYATPRSVSACTSPRPSRWRVDGKVPRHLKKKYAWEPSEAALTANYDLDRKQFQSLAREPHGISSTTPVKASTVTPSSMDIPESNKAQRTTCRKGDRFNSSNKRVPQDDARDGDDVDSVKASSNPAPRGAENISPTSGLKAEHRVGFNLEQFSSDTDSEPERFVRSDPNLAARTKGLSLKRRLSLRRKKAPEKSKRDDVPEKSPKKKKRMFAFLKWLGLKK